MKLVAATLSIFLFSSVPTLAKTICYKIHRDDKTTERCIIKGKIVDGTTVDYDQRLAVSKGDDGKGHNSLGKKREPANKPMPAADPKTPAAAPAPGK